MSVASSIIYWAAINLRHLVADFQAGDASASDNYTFLRRMPFIGIDTKCSDEAVTW
jgi:hypothetical protein